MPKRFAIALSALATYTKTTRRARGARLYMPNPHRRTKVRHAHQAREQQLSTINTGSGTQCSVIRGKSARIMYNTYYCIVLYYFGMYYCMYIYLYILCIYKYIYLSYSTYILIYTCIFYVYNDMITVYACMYICVTV